MLTQLKGGLAHGQVHRTDLIKLLTPCHNLQEDELLGILQNPTWWPDGVLKVTPSTRDASSALGVTVTVANPSRTHPHFSQSSYPVSIDLPYAIPLWLASLFGGAIRLNGNKAIGKPFYKSYVRFRLKGSNYTLPSVIMDAKAGTQAIASKANPHSCRRLTLNIEGGTRSIQPRKAFVESAARLFEDHAPLELGVTLEQYLTALTGWFAKADKRYEELEALKAIGDDGMDKASSPSPLPHA